MPQPAQWSAPWPEPPTVTRFDNDHHFYPRPLAPAARAPMPGPPRAAPMPGYAHPPPPRNGASLQPGPPPPGGERYSWYPDIAASYEEESSYEPSVHSPDLHKERALSPEPYKHEDDAAKDIAKQPLSRRTRLKQHLRRRWYFYVIGMIVGMAISMPIFFLVILPAVIQKMVDAAPFPLMGVSFTEPGLHSFMMSMKSGMNIPGPFAVIMDPTNLTLTLADDPSGTMTSGAFATVALPQYTLHGNTTLEIPKQNVTVKDSAAFVKFIHTCAIQETYSIRTQGSTVIRLGALKANIKIDKTLTIPGFNSFKGFAIPDAQLLLTPKADGSNFIGNATLPNPTVVTMEVGDFTMNIMAGNITLGQATVPNLTLKPGDTTVPLYGKVDMQTMLHNFEDILKTQTGTSGGLAQGNLVFNSTMNSTVFNGQRLTDFEKAFDGVVLNAALPITEVISDSVDGFLNGGESLASVGSTLLQSMNISSLSSILGPLGAGAATLLKNGGTSLLSELV